MLSLQDALSRCPLVAILRGVKPGEEPEHRRCSRRCRLRIIEVPLNSPEPLESIALLVKAFAEKCWSAPAR